MRKQVLVTCHKYCLPAQGPLKVLQNKKKEEFLQSRDREKALSAEMGGANEALGYAAGGEESPVINTTEEETSG